MTPLFIFLLLFHLPSFGGDTRVRFEFQTLDGCQRLSHEILKKMAEMSVNKFEVLRDCEPDLGLAMPPPHADAVEESSAVDDPRLPVGRGGGP